MPKIKNTAASPLMVIVAFAIVYIVWGSTYFFIQKALKGFPPFLIGAIRFLSAALLMLLWCLYKKEEIFIGRQLKHAFITGLLLLFIGNGSVIWVEQYLSSGLVAITIASSPLWFVLFDKPKWKENLTSKATIGGLLMGFIGVLLLFYEHILKALYTKSSGVELGGMIIVILAAMSWAGGSIYSKYAASGSSASVSSAWQMFAAGLAFSIVSLIRGETSGLNWAAIPVSAWASLAYLIFFGSILAFSAYIWLLEVRPATQVSTYAYVNPVVAVLLGIFLASESISMLQITGLVVILTSVLLINLVKYRQEKIRSKTLVNEV